MNTPETKKAPALGGATGAIKNRKSLPFQEEGITMNTSIPQAGSDREKFSSFEVATGHARIFIEENREYWGGDTTVPLAVRLTDNSESHLLLSAAEALSVAAALQAVAVHLMEQASTEREAA